MASSHSTRNTTIVLEGFAPLDPSLPKLPFVDYTGQKFGRLTVLRYAGRRHIKNGTQMCWLCQCECGRITLARSSQFHRPRDNMSCGCSISKKNWKHKRSNIRHHPLYTTWSNIVRRTTDAVAYIARGMCDGFRELDHFAAVMGTKPSAGHSVDRINNNGGYWCGCCTECIRLGRTKNVRWATAQEQATNKGNNRWITHNGVTKTISQWEDETGVSRGTIAARLRAGRPTEEAIEMPLLGNERGDKPINLCDETQAECAELYLGGETLSRLAAKYHCDRHTIARYLKRLGVSLRNRSDWMKVGLAKARTTRNAYVCPSEQ